MSLCIKIQNLTKRYKDHAVIRNLNVSVTEGEVVVFQGSSGIGKSTFLRCLTYLEPFQEGTVRIGDVELHANMDVRKEKLKIKAVREQLGFVFQFFNLFPHLTVLENLTLGPIRVLKQPEARANEFGMRLLERVGLCDKAHAKPNSLSGGQQQRVGIARALAMRPKAILFDEPTSSLDPDMKNEIVSVMESLAKEGLTMLIVTHEPAFIDRIATRRIKFGSECRILEDSKK